MSILNWFINLPFVSEFLAQHIIVQFIVAFVLLFVFFIIVMEIKLIASRWRKRGGLWKIGAYILIIVFGALFLLADAGMNIVYMPMIFLQRANKFGEGWLVTSRLQYHKAQPGMYYQKRISLFICDRFVEKVDPGHCETSRFDK